MYGYITMFWRPEYAQVKGDASLEVVRLMMRMRREAGDQEFSASGMCCE